MHPPMHNGLSQYRGHLLLSFRHIVGSPWLISGKREKRKAEMEGGRTEGREKSREALTFFLFVSIKRSDFQISFSGQVWY